MDEIKGIRIVSLTGEKEYGIEDSEVREELAEVVDGAPEELNSFREAFEKFKEGGEVDEYIRENAMKYNTLGVSVYPDKAKILCQMHPVRRLEMVLRLLQQEMQMLHLELNIPQKIH